MSRTNTKQMVIRMSDDQHERIKKKVAASGLKQQDYLLKAILNKPIVNTDGLREFSSQLKNIGNNLNQLTRLANMGFPIDRRELAAPEQCFQHRNYHFRSVFDSKNVNTTIL